MSREDEDYHIRFALLCNNVALFTGVLIRCSPITKKYIYLYIQNQYTSGVYFQSSIISIGLETVQLCSSN